jgi:hypothetical protein
MKPVLRAPETKCLQLTCDVPLSNFAFRFNVRRYTLVFGFNETFELKHGTHDDTVNVITRNAPPPSPPPPSPTLPPPPSPPPPRQGGAD